MAARMNKVKRAPATMEEALERFITWKKANGISDQTLLDYKTHVNLLFKRFPDAEKSYDQLESAVLEHLSQEGIKPATYNNRLVYLRTFFNWCIEQGMIEDNPLEGFRKRKDEGRQATIDEATLARLIALPNRETYAGLRDYTLILLFLDSGIRPKEAFSLTEDDFHPIAREMHVDASKAKTRMSRTLPMSPMTVDAIQELLSVRPAEWKRGTPIFCTNEGKPLTRHTWGDRMEMYCKKLGTHIWPYALRHAFSIIFLRGGGNAFGLQKMLGHVDMTMTKRYVRLSDTDVREQHNTASPLNRLIQQKVRVGKLK